MSGFWDTLIRKINKNDIQSILSLTTLAPKEISETLKKHNIPTDNVLWMNGEISSQMKKVNMEHIKEYDSSTIQGGY